MSCQMPAAYVLDASVGIRLFIEEEYSDVVQNLFQERLSSMDECLFVPDLFFIECTNILWKKVRRGEYDITSANNDLVDLADLALPSTSCSDLMERAFEIANTFGITAYDACYVALAEMKNLPLLTADDRLAQALAGSQHKVVTLCQIA